MLKVEHLLGIAQTVTEFGIVIKETTFTWKYLTLPTGKRVCFSLLPKFRPLDLCYWPEKKKKNGHQEAKTENFTEIYTIVVT